jgi:Potential Queuosine, Q, salvage protein family
MRPPFLYGDDASPMTSWDVRGSCASVAADAAHVRVPAAALPALADALTDAPAPPAWGFPHLRAAGVGAEAAASWTLLLSALNFCFWEDEPRWRVAGADGYMALAHALRRAWDWGLPVAQPSAWASWSVGDLAAVLRGDSGGPAAPPMLAERHAVAAELGAWLRDAYGGSGFAAVADAESAFGFASLLASSLRLFRDVAEYRGRRVPLLKRAQIAAHDCGLALGSSCPAGLRDRSGLTAFADYKLPQVLRAAGGFEYSPALAGTVDARVELASGSEEEVEIRACTVVAVDSLVALLHDRGRPVDAPLVDSLLWWRGQGLQTRPYHRVRTVWY